jgi:DNA-binding transcriptional LysR family regulator
MKKTLLISLTLIVLLFAVSCSQEEPEIEPLDVVTVAITPSARHTSLAVSTCASTISEANFEISEVYPSQAKADLVIRLGEPDPPAAFTTQIAEEELVIVLHPDNPAGSLTLDQVQQLFGGNIQDWSDLGGAGDSVIVWSLLPADETRQIFVQKVLNNGLIATNAFLAPHPEKMASTIADNPAAIGYLPQSWTNPDLSSILPGVSIPVLVTSASQPQGAAHELVACLQGELGQELLSAYFPN